MADRLAFSDVARLGGRDARAVAACLVRVLGPATRGYPALAELVARCLDVASDVELEREACLDVCTDLLDLAARARRRGRDTEAFALAGVEALLLEALVAPASA